ncbi:glycosyltransferase family 4 protein [Aquimarina algicola]|uniref:Glycosyltransferase family 4 protein n=1 Tax=Aquimarina algicola TaxID=2589995 RepID=A0A504J9K8_9FLAO|nr:glycosyltransferase family 4 protein [Aquimarina algicola]TPN84558.1 glycosyltransferase family 4 protein [Aquimarina algicola]
MNHILIIGFVWPEPNSSAAGSRMLQLINLFLDQNWKITFASPALETQHMTDLEKLGISTVNIKVNDSSFDIFIKEENPEVVLFDRFIIEEQFGWRVTQHCPNTIKILNTEDLHCLRKTRHQALKNDKEFTLEQLLDNDHTKREIASIYRCDLSLIISDFELEILTNTFNIPSQLLFYIPFLLDPITEEIKKQWLPFEQRKHFITIGNFRHEPNWDSILYLKKTIWPLIKEEISKEIELHIYGAYPPPKATQLQNSSLGFHIKGWAQNSKTVLSQAKICIAPLRFGAGIKGKLAESMLCGTPSITTSIGAEGMIHDDIDWNGFIVDNPIRFAKAAIKLYNNKNLWLQSQQNGIRIINAKFQKKQFSDKLFQHIQKISSNLKKHRNTNFIGKMLQFHTLRSTEFMARWIEAKNKKE